MKTLLLAIALFAGLLLMAPAAKADDVCYPPVPAFELIGPIPCPPIPDTSDYSSWPQQCDATGYFWYSMATYIYGYADPDWFYSAYGCYPY